MSIDRASLLKALETPIACLPPPEYFLCENSCLDDHQIINLREGRTRNYLQCGTYAFYKMVFMYSKTLQEAVDICSEHALNKIYKAIDREVELALNSNTCMKIS